MKSSTKKIVVSLLVVLAFVVIYGYNKAKTLVGIFDKMTIAPAGISNVDVSLDRFKFNIDVKLTNPTQEDFTVSGYGLAELQEISIFYDGLYIATSQVNLSEISIPGENELIIHNIAVEVPKPLQFVANNIATIGQMIIDFNKFNISKLSTTGIINVAGQTIEI